MKFKILISYENSCIEEILEIDSQNAKQAKQKCEEIKINNLEKIQYLEKRNIYSSKIIKDCVIKKTNWYDDAIGCELDLENNV